jgi:hypothetical protein
MPYNRISRRVYELSALERLLEKDNGHERVVNHHAPHYILLWVLLRTARHQHGLRSFCADFLNFPGIFHFGFHTVEALAVGGHPQYRRLLV